MSSLFLHLLKDGIVDTDLISDALIFIFYEYILMDQS